MQQPLTLPRPASVSLRHVLPMDPIVWPIFAVVAAVVAPWQSAASVTITGLGDLAIVMVALLVLRACLLTLRPDFHRLPILLETAALVFAQTAVIAPLSYLCARNAWPLWDAAFGTADKAMGYDWHAWADYEESIPSLSRVLNVAYDSFSAQSVVILATLPFLQGGRRGFTFVRATLIAALVACAGSYFLPAAMPEAIHTAWYPHWAALRGVQPFTISFGDMQGIVTFPSFHASLAIIFVYSVRGLGPITWAFGVLNGLMLVATTTYGHHYFSDVVAGVVVGIAAIALARFLDRHAPAELHCRSSTG